MRPTGKIRWLVTSNEVTKNEIDEYRKSADVCLTEAKRILEDRKPPKLQQWVVVNEWKNEGEWADIPIEYEIHHKQI